MIAAARAGGDGGAGPVPTPPPSSVAPDRATQRDHRSYSDDTYRQYDKLQDAINDFTNAMGVGKIRLAADPAHVIREWDKLGVAVGDFFDHLTDTYDYGDRS